MLVYYHMHQSNIPQGTCVRARKEECAFAITQPVNPFGFVPYSETHVESITLRQIILGSQTASYGYMVTEPFFIPS